MLSPEQYKFIEYLAQPKKGGLTMQQIADKIGVHRRTLYNWQNDTAVQKKLKEIVLKHSFQDMPEIMESIKAGIVEDRNAQMARVWADMHGLLTKGGDRQEDTEQPANSVEAMQERIEKYRKRQNKVVSINK